MIYHGSLIVIMPDMNSCSIAGLFMIGSDMQRLCRYDICKLHFYEPFLILLTSSCMSRINDLFL